MTKEIAFLIYLYEMELSSHFSVQDDEVGVCNEIREKFIELFGINDLKKEHGIDE